MTDRVDRSTKEKSKLRQQRRVARRKLEEKLGRKLRPGETVDHIKPKKGSSNYDNSKGNLKAVSQKQNIKNAKKNGMTGGRPKKK